MKLSDMSDSERTILGEFLRDLADFVCRWPQQRRERLEREENLRKLQQAWEAELRRREWGGR